MIVTVSSRVVVDPTTKWLLNLRIKKSTSTEEVEVKVKELTPRSVMVSEANSPGIIQRMIHP